MYAEQLNFLLILRNSNDLLFSLRERILFFQNIFRDYQLHHLLPEKRLSDFTHSNSAQNRSRIIRRK